MSRADNPRGVRPAAIAVVIVVCFVGLQMREATEHVIVDRDPGVYLTTGLSLARTGSLLVDPQSSAFGSPPPAHVRFDSPGYYTGAPDGQLYPQFLHVLPVLIAVGEGIGGPAGAVKVPALLEGIEEREPDPLYIALAAPPAHLRRARLFCRRAGLADPTQVPG